jgi:hypothetical protein
MFLTWIRNIFSSNNTEQLELENKQLKEKLVEKQEHINKTNAYWKKKIYESKVRK